MSVAATIIDGTSGKPIGVLLDVGLHPRDMAGPTWRLRAWRVSPDTLAAELLDSRDPKAHREDVYVEAVYPGGDALPELRLIGEQLDFMRRHPAFRALP